MKQRVAIVQRDIKWCDAKANFEALESMLVGVEADIVVLSEMFPTGFATTPMSVAKDGAALEWMQMMASRMDAAIVGSVATKVGSEYRNRLYFVKPDGSYAYYDKRHLFSVGGEAEHFAAGQERKVQEWRGVRYLLSVCYDLRFPVWCRQRSNDYDAMINVALWPKARRRVWRTLLSARAIENQAYVIGVNRIGEEPSGLVYSGDSMVVDFYGEPIADMEDRAGVTVVDLDTEALGAFRMKFPAWRDADNFEIL